MQSRSAGALERDRRGTDRDQQQRHRPLVVRADEVGMDAILVFSRKETASTSWSVLAAESRWTSMTYE
jgi:hypothetical protein